MPLPRGGGGKRTLARRPFAAPAPTAWTNEGCAPTRCAICPIAWAMRGATDLVGAAAVCQLRKGEREASIYSTCRSARSSWWRAPSLSSTPADADADADVGASWGGGVALSVGRMDGGAAPTSSATRCVKVSIPLAVLTYTQPQAQPHTRHTGSTDVRPRLHGPGETGRRTWRLWTCPP